MDTSLETQTKAVDTPFVGLIIRIKDSLVDKLFVPGEIVGGRKLERDLKTLKRR